LEQKKQVKTKSGQKLVLVVRFEVQAQARRSGNGKKKDYERGGAHKLSQISKSKEKKNGAKAGWRHVIVSGDQRGLRRKGGNLKE